MRTIIWYFFSWSYLVVTYPLLLKAKYFNKKGKTKQLDWLAYKFTQNFSRFIVKLSGSSVSVKGAENIPPSGAVLFVSNHQSHFDSALIHGFIDRPKGFVSTIEARSFPILIKWMEYMKCIFIDRNDVRQSFDCIKQGVEFLREGHSMVVYPEGRLNEGKDILEFKRGSLKLAVKAGVPIIPVTIKGSCHMMTRNGGKIRPYNVECIISQPIETSNISKDGERELADKIRNIISSNL